MTLLLALAAALSPAMVPNDYRNGANWLCRPGRQDNCAGDIAQTIVYRDGTYRRTARSVPAAPRADCFYIYPTVSPEPTPNSDMIPGIAERGMVAAQLSPFRNVCRNFAPLYRQVTLAALRGQASPGNIELAYADVLNAWRSYLARDNQGRPFVLIGHSQGSMLLKRLLIEEIDGKPVQRRMLSAILPGTSVIVPQGEDVGGDLKAVPLCRADTQTGCVVTWASYRDTTGAPANGLFGSTRPLGTAGKPVAADMAAGCTNPAKLSGGAVALDGILGFPWWRGGIAQYRPPASGWTVNGSPITTRFVKMPDLLTGQCLVNGGFSYLSVHIASATPADLANTLVGTAAVGDADYPEWGFHVIDLAIVEGDLVRLVSRQTVSWYRCAIRSPNATLRGSRKAGCEGLLPSRSRGICVRIR